jgi:hypothetical protein
MFRNPNYQQNNNDIEYDNYKIEKLLDKKLDNRLNEKLLERKLDNRLNQMIINSIRTEIPYWLNHHPLLTQIVENYKLELKDIINKKSLETKQIVNTNIKNQLNVLFSKPEYNNLMTVHLDHLKHTFNKNTDNFKKELSYKTDRNTKYLEIIISLFFVLFIVVVYFLLIKYFSQYN